MEAGRELDALVAEKVMGWTGIRGAFDEDFWPVGTPPENQGKHLVAGVLEIQILVPNYSTDIAAAWEVVFAVEEQGFRFFIERSHCWDQQEGGGWFVRCKERKKPYREAFADMKGKDSAPLAICLAALKAKGVEI